MSDSDLLAVTDRHVDIETAEGTMGTFVAHPDAVGSDTGAFPTVVFLMDAPGKRELLHNMARRIAENGYFVVLPNLYYRTTPAFELDFESKASFDEMVPLMMSMGNKMVGRDVGALIDFAATQDAADTTTVGTVGYCMSGPFAIWAAAEFPEQIKAAASFYGVRLHVDKDDSPHKRLDEISAELYVGAAEHDDYIDLDMIDRFEAAMQASGPVLRLGGPLEGRVERYWGTHHGFAFNDRPSYDLVADERHWRRLLDLFARNLNGRSA